MTEQTKTILKIAYNDCKDNNRSLEYTIQYMCNYAKVSEDCVISWITKFSGDYEENKNPSFIK